jgi:chloride channel protein, CIC family
MSAPSPDPGTHLQSRSDGRLLVLAAILGAPISAAAYGFLAVVTSLQQWIFTDLPMGLGFDGTSLWSLLRLLPLAGLLVGLTIRYLRGTGGHVPVVGLKSRGRQRRQRSLVVAAAALASLSVGVVLGPEAPLTPSMAGSPSAPSAWPAAPCLPRPR